MVWNSKYWSEIILCCICPIKSIKGKESCGQFGGNFPTLIQISVLKKIQRKQLPFAPPHFQWQELPFISERDGLADIHTSPYQLGKSLLVQEGYDANSFQASPVICIRKQHPAFDLFHPKRQASTVLADAKITCTAFRVGLNLEIWQANAFHNSIFCAHLPPVLRRESSRHHEDFGKITNPFSKCPRPCISSLIPFLWPLVVAMAGASWTWRHLVAPHCFPLPSGCLYAFLHFLDAVKVETSTQRGKVVT